MHVEPKPVFFWTNGWSIMPRQVASLSYLKCMIWVSCDVNLSVSDGGKCDLRRTKTNKQPSHNNKLCIDPSHRRNPISISTTYISHHLISKTVSKSLYTPSSCLWTHKYTAMGHGISTARRNTTGPAEVVDISPPNLLAAVIKMSMQNLILHAQIFHAQVTQNLNQELQRLRVEKTVFAKTWPSRLFSTWYRRWWFYVFPPEVRLMIWKPVAHQPRVVEAREFPNSPAADEQYGIHKNTPPSIMHVNRESRQEALRYYKLGGLSDRMYQTYFNSASDVLYIQFHLIDTVKFTDKL